MKVTFWIYYGQTTNLAVSVGHQVPVPRPQPKWPHLFWFGVVVCYGF